MFVVFQDEKRCDENSCYSCGKPISDGVVMDFEYSEDLVWCSDECPRRTKKDEQNLIEEMCTDVKSTM